ncbi:hypothetical protein [Streptomyces sp. NPDC055709]
MPLIERISAEIRQIGAMIARAGRKLPSVNNAGDQYIWDMRRGVQDGADRLEAVTAFTSKRSASTIASAAVSGRARAIHPTVDRVPSPHTHRAWCTSRTGCPAVRRPVK